MTWVDINYLLFGNPLLGYPVAGFSAGLLAALATRLCEPQKTGTKSFSDVLGSVLIRIFLGIVIAFVFLVLNILSAIPYGGGNQGLFLIFRTAFVLAPFWAAYAFVDIRTGAARTAAKQNNAVRIDRKFIAGSLLILISAGLVLRTFMPPALSAKDMEREARNKRYWKALPVCKKELSGIASEYLVESLLLDTNKIEQFTLKRLLGDKGVRFVELKADVIEGKNEKTDAWGLGGYRDLVSLMVDKEVKYVRFDLSIDGDSRCSNEIRISSTGPRAPFSPYACIRVTTDQQARASHAIKAFPLDDGSGLIRWTLVEQSTGNVLAALTSGDQPNNPRRVRGASSWESIDCDQPYFTFTNVLRGTPPNTRQGLSLVRRKIKPRVVDLGSDAIAWPEIPVDETRIPDSKGNEDKRTHPWGKDWKAAYGRAEETGFADVGGELIDYANGELLSLGSLKFGPDSSKFGPHWLHGETGASKHGFVFVFQRPSGIHLVRYDFDGEMKWQGLIRPNGYDKSTAGKLNLSSVKWADDEIRIYVYKRNEKDASYSLLRIPDSVVGVKQ
jgi:hypothetical protein